QFSRAWKYNDVVIISMSLNVNKWPTDSWISIIDGIKFKNRKTSKIKEMVPFKTGWIITLKAIRLLLSELFEIDGISFVLTRRLNQDPVEVSYH
ncbi:MAG: hypothetical protein AAGK05_09200, partial [Pseudomonadota bacterium]